MKKILMCLSLCLCLAGCVSGPGYERSKEMATINNTTWESMMERIDNKETFMFMITFDECSSCEYFIENVLRNYMKNHGFELNRVNFTNDLWEEKRDDVSDFIIENPYSADVQASVDDYEEGTLLTPTLYFVQDGKICDMLVGSTITDIELDTMIVKYQLDEVK